MYDKQERIYPNLREPSAPPDESQIYRLNTIKEIEEFLNKEIVERLRLQKKFRQAQVISYLYKPRPYSYKCHRYYRWYH